MVGTESAVTESPYLAAFSSSRRCRWEAAADAFADRGLRKSRNWESAGEERGGEKLDAAAYSAGSRITLVDCLAAGSDSKVGRSLPTVPIGGPSGALFAGLFSGTFCELHDFHPTFALLFIYF